MKKRLLIILFLVLIKVAQAQAGGDSAWSMHAGILYSKFGTGSKIFSGLDLKAGYDLGKLWQAGLNLQLLMLDDNNVSPYTLIGGGPYLRFNPGRITMDLSGTAVSGTRKKETITLYTTRISIGAINKMAEKIFLNPQAFFQYEYATGRGQTSTIRPGILLAVLYHF